MPTYSATRVQIPSCGTLPIPLPSLSLPSDKKTYCNIQTSMVWASIYFCNFLTDEYKQVHEWQVLLPCHILRVNISVMPNAHCTTSFLTHEPQTLSPYCQESTLPLLFVWKYSILSFQKTLQSCSVRLAVKTQQQNIYYPFNSKCKREWESSGKTKLWMVLGATQGNKIAWWKWYEPFTHVYSEECIW